MKLSITKKNFISLNSALLITAILAITGCCPFAKKAPTEYSFDSGSSRPYRTSYKTPENIYFLMQELKAFYNSGGYDKAMEQVGQAAMEALIKNQNTPGKLAIVLDIDETSLSNYKYEVEYNFGFSGTTWNEWVKKCDRTVIEPSLALFNQAKKQGVAVFFITGTTEEDRPYYEENLKKAGYSGWTELVMEEKGKSYPYTETFKTAARKKITEDGYRIIINIGDQYSDLIGGYADKTFKYPNPFYYIP